MPQGEPLSRPGLQPGPHPPAAGASRGQGRRTIRAGHLGDGPRTCCRPPPRRDRHLGWRSVLPWWDAGTQGLDPDVGARSPVLRTSGCHTTHGFALRRYRPCGRRSTLGTGLRRRSNGRPACSAGAALGYQHQADQPSSVAVRPGGERTRGPGGGDRPDPDRHRTGRRLVHPAAARHRRCPDAGDDARLDPRRPHRPGLRRRLHGRLR